VIDLSIIFIFNKLYIVFCSVLKKKGYTEDCALAHADERSAKIKNRAYPPPSPKKAGTLEQWLKTRMNPHFFCSGRVCRIRTPEQKSGTNGS
jgi:hypothetical protein